MTSRFWELFVTRGNCCPSALRVRRLLQCSAMEFICRHCDEVITGAVYRVISKEDDVVLLDMTVCDLCRDQARQLGLYTEQINLDHTTHRQRSARYLAGMGRSYEFHRAP